MYKKIVSFFIIIALLFSLCALCGCKKGNVPLPEEFTLAMKEVKFSQPNDSMTLYSGEVPLSDILWSSNDETVATFDGGVVSAKGPGKTEVIAEYFGVKHTCLVDCTSLIYTKEVLGEDYPCVEYSGEAVLAPPKAFEGPSTYYDNAAFIGDSVSLKLSYYAEDTGELGNAKFLVSGSYGVGHAVDDTMLLVYQGQEMTPQDALAAAKVDKVFVMFGMNDLGRFGLDGTMDYWAKFVKNIKENNPGITICIQSMTPVYSSGETGDLNNETVDEYNERLKTFAKENSCSFMDIASFMKDANGGLASDYCSDSFVHLTDAGAFAWIQVLKAYAGS